MTGELFSGALGYAHRLLAVRDRSEKEIRDRLSSKGHDAGSIEQVVDDLRERGLLDDKRFAREWIKTRMTGSPRGVYAIRKELLGKGIGEELIKQALEDADTGYDEKKVAARLAAKKLDSIKSGDMARRKKSLHDYLARRGFSFDTINDVLDGI
jgi:regulatory protein